MYKHILIPTNGTELSDKTIDAGSTTDGKPRVDLVNHPFHR